MSIVFLVALLLLAAVTFVAVFLMRARLRFSLRWLLMVVAMVAVVLGTLRWWQTYGLAQVERIDPASAEAAAIRPNPVIVARHDEKTDRDEYTARFVPRYRSIDKLVDLPEVDEARASAHDEASGSFGITYYHTMQQVEYESSSRAELAAVLKTVQEADVARPDLDESVIFGIVVDSHGKPVANATVDLLGPRVYVNNFVTRDDGTFHMPITAPAGRGYYLRIRYGENQTMRTTSFSYEGPDSELGLRVTVQ